MTEVLRSNEDLQKLPGRLLPKPVPIREMSAENLKLVFEDQKRRVEDRLEALSRLKELGEVDYLRDQQTRYIRALDSAKVGLRQLYNERFQAYVMYGANTLPRYDELINKQTSKIEKIQRIVDRLGQLVPKADESKVPPKDDVW
jgi:hypothetical protein